VKQKDQQISDLNKMIKKKTNEYDLLYTQMNNQAEHSLRSSTTNAPQTTISTIKTPLLRKQEKEKEKELIKIEKQNLEREQILIIENSTLSNRAINQKLEIQDLKTKLNKSLELNLQNESQHNQNVLLLSEIEKKENLLLKNNDLIKNYSLKNKQQEKCLTDSSGVLAQKQAENELFIKTINLKNSLFEIKRSECEINLAELTDQYQKNKEMLKKTKKNIH